MEVRKGKVDSRLKGNETNGRYQAPGRNEQNYHQHFRASSLILS